MGSKAFSITQYGKEATRGIAVAATKKFIGQVVQVTPDRKPDYPSDNIGVRADAVRGIIYQTLVQNTLSSPHGYFQALPAIFGCGLKGGITPTEQTVGQSDFLWTFTPSLIANNAPDSLTIEYGDDVQAVEAEYCMFERIRISGTVAQGAEPAPVSIEADYFGRQLTPVSFTPAIAIPVMETMSAKLTKFYLDTAWAGVGTTEQINILRAFEIEILTGVHPIFTSSGDKFFNVHGEDIIAVMVNLTLEGNASANAVWNAHREQSLAVARLKITGGMIGTGLPHSLTVDIGGTWEAVTPLGGEDRGNNLHIATLHGIYNATGAKMLQVAVSTNINAY